MRVRYLADILRFLGLITTPLGDAIFEFRTIYG